MISRITSLFVDALTEFMETMVGLECTIVPMSEVDQWNAEISGVVAVSGNPNGKVAVSFPRDLGRSVVARVMGKDINEVDEEALCDGIGEIANIIAGNAKGRLSQLGFDLTISLPSTLNTDCCVDSTRADWTVQYEIRTSLGKYKLSIWLTAA
jgi:chemotaxis protein CheX